MDSIPRFPWKGVEGNESIVEGIGTLRAVGLERIECAVEGGALVGINALLAVSALSKNGIDSYHTAFERQLVRVAGTF